MKSWYSRDYLGKAFDRFLDSEMSSKDFMQLQQELQSVSVQLRELDSFIKSGFQNPTGKIPIKIGAGKET